MWHKILQALCRHQWYQTESCGRKVLYCRKCGKMMYMHR